VSPVPSARPLNPARRPFDACTLPIVTFPRCVPHCFGPRDLVVRRHEPRATRPAGGARRATVSPHAHARGFCKLPAAFSFCCNASARRSVALYISRPRARWALRADLCQTDRVPQAHAAHSTSPADPADALRGESACVAWLRRRVPPRRTCRGKYRSKRQSSRSKRAYESLFGAPTLMRLAPRGRESGFDYA
jgi:hypothetical protein